MEQPPLEMGQQRRAIVVLKTLFALDPAFLETPQPTTTGKAAQGAGGGAGGGRAQSQLSILIHLHLHALL